MWTVLFAGIVILAFFRFNRLIGSAYRSRLVFEVFIIGWYLMWMIIELRISKKDLNTEGKKTSDRMTCQLYGTGQALTILTALWFSPGLQAPDGLSVVGLVLYLSGSWYRLWAVHTLGRFYSHRVQTIAQHKIVTTGPYRFTRHPAYAGMILAHAGICICYFNWVTVCIFAFILVPAILLRIAIEEKILFKVKGYPEFAQTRKRLIPAVW
jgi:protein-S-isoprenylcysteine O-methyltransferase Ste14